MEFKRDQLGLKLKRRTFFGAKLHAELAKVREDRRLYQCRKQTLDENRLKAEAEMQRKEVDLDDVTRKLLTRTSNSPTVFDQLTAVIESLRCDIWSLEAKLETMDTQARSLNRDQHTLQKYIDCLNGELDGSFKVWTNTTGNVVLCTLLILCFIGTSCKCGWVHISTHCRCKPRQNFPIYMTPIVCPLRNVHTIIIIIIYNNNIFL